MTAHGGQQIGQVLAEDGDRGECLLGGHVPHEASTTSGSSPSSLLARARMPMPWCSARSLRRWCWTAASYLMQPRSLAFLVLPHPTGGSW